MRPSSGSSIRRSARSAPTAESVRRRDVVEGYRGFRPFRKQDFRGSVLFCGSGGSRDAFGCRPGAIARPGGGPVECRCAARGVTRAAAARPLRRCRPARGARTRRARRCATAQQAVGQLFEHGPLRLRAQALAVHDAHAQLVVAAAIVEKSTDRLACDGGAPLSRAGRSPRARCSGRAADPAAAAPAAPA